MYPQRTRHRPPWLEVDGLFHMGPQCMTEYKRKENSAVLLEFFHAVGYIFSKMY